MFLINCRLLKLLEKRGKLSTKAAKALDENYVPEREDDRPDKAPKLTLIKKRSKKVKDTNTGEVVQHESKFNFSCAVCKKKFRTYVNMCRHRRLAHKDIKQEEKKPVVPPELNLTEIKPRPKASRMKLLTEPIIKKRDEKAIVFESASDPVDNSPETVAAFYANVAHNIAENLNRFIDGGVDSITNCKEHIRVEDSNSNVEMEAMVKTEEEEEEKFSWERFNFPSNYDPSVDNFIDIEEQEKFKIKEDKQEIFDDGIPYVEKGPALCTRRRSSLEGISSAENSRDGLELLRSPRKKETPISEAKNSNGLIAKVCENLAKKMLTSPEKIADTNAVSSSSSECKTNDTHEPINSSKTNNGDTKTAENVSEKDDKFVSAIEMEALQSTPLGENTNETSSSSILRLPLMFKSKEPEQNDSSSENLQTDEEIPLDNSDKKITVEESTSSKLKEDNSCIRLNESKMDTVQTVVGEDCLQLLENLENISNTELDEVTAKIDCEETLQNKLTSDVHHTDNSGSSSVDPAKDVHKLNIPTESLNKSISSNVSSHKSSNKKTDTDDDGSDCEIEFYDITSVMEASLANQGSGYADSSDGTHERPNTTDRSGSSADNDALRIATSSSSPSGEGSKGDNDDNMSGYSSEGVYNPPLSDSDSDFDEHLGVGIPVGLLLHQLKLANSSQESNTPARNNSLCGNIPDAEKIYRNLLNNRNLRAKRSPNYNPLDNYESITFGKNGPPAYVCSVCKKYFDEYDTLVRHQLKKHPSVHCSHLHIEQGHEIEYLFYSEPSHVGLLGEYLFYFESSHVGLLGKYMYLFSPYIVLLTSCFHSVKVVLHYK